MRQTLTELTAHLTAAQLADLERAVRAWEELRRLGLEAEAAERAVQAAEDAAGRARAARDAAWRAWAEVVPLDPAVRELLITAAQAARPVQAAPPKAPTRRPVDVEALRLGILPRVNPELLGSWIRRECGRLLGLTWPDEATLADTSDWAGEASSRLVADVMWAATSDPVHAATLLVTGLPDGERSEARQRLQQMIGEDEPEARPGRREAAEEWAALQGRG